MATRALIICKANITGAVRPGHRYLWREGEPGNYTYVYEEKQQGGVGDGPSAAKKAGIMAPVAGQQAAGGENANAAAAPGTKNPYAGLRPPHTPNAPGQGVGDVTPQSFTQGLIVLWKGLTVAEYQTAHKSGVLATGSCPLSGTRMTALKSHPGADVLVAVKVPQARLHAGHDGHTVMSALQGGGTVEYRGGPLPMALVAAVVTPEDKLWPKLPKEAKQANSGGKNG